MGRSKKRGLNSSRIPVDQNQETSSKKETEQYVLKGNSGWKGQLVNKACPLALNALST